ncbi:hypothetical protein [Halocola ammonii]
MNLKVTYRGAELFSATDYYPGGSLMPGKSFNETSYRFGYQGSEKTDEIAGSGNHYTTYFRELDTRILRWWSRDPKMRADESPYAVNRNNSIRYNDPKGDCPPGTDCGVGIRFNASLGGGGFSLSLYGGVQSKNQWGFFMTGANAQATFVRGGAGTSQYSPNLFTFTVSPSVTFGSGSADPMELNLFTGNSGSGVNNTFRNSFTYGINAVFSSGMNSDHSGRSQLLAAVSIRLNNLALSSYNDTKKFPFFSTGADQFFSAGLNGQLKNGDNTLFWSNDMYYGMSDQGAKYNQDRIINGQNYDNQRPYDVLLNNGRETLAMVNSNFGVLQMGTRSGLNTFYPSNSMHDNIRIWDKEMNRKMSFHHLYVPYPNTQQRMVNYGWLPPQ